MMRCLRGVGAIVLLLCVSAAAAACKHDADCGPGGTCIKRERNASGVCYGRAPHGADEQPPAANLPQDGANGEEPPAVAPRPVQGERREHAKALLGDPDAMIREHLPGREVGGTCIVTQDCASGFECVTAGFEGHCVKL